MSELKPCPFCGGEVDWCRCSDVGCYRIVCLGCDFFMDSEGADGDTLDDLRLEMLRRWNERSTPQWQPIETAPKDGRRFLFANGESVVGTAYLLNGIHFAADSWQGSKNTVPTHWMPLPDPPKK